MWVKRGEGGGRPPCRPTFQYSFHQRKIDVPQWTLVTKLTPGTHSTGTEIRVELEPEPRPSPPNRSVKPDNYTTSTACRKSSLFSICFYYYEYWGHRGTHCTLWSQWRKSELTVTKVQNRNLAIMPLDKQVITRPSGQYQPSLALGTDIALGAHVPPLRLCHNLH